MYSRFEDEQRRMSASAVSVNGWASPAAPAQPAPPAPAPPSSLTLALLTSSRALVITALSFHTVGAIFAVVAMAVPSYLITSSLHIGMFESCTTSPTYSCSTFDSGDLPTIFLVFRSLFLAAFVVHVLNVIVSVRSMRGQTIRSGLVRVAALFAFVVSALYSVSLALFASRVQPLASGSVFGFSFYAHIVTMTLYVMGTLSLIQGAARAPKIDANAANANANGDAAGVPMSVMAPPQQQQPAQGGYVAPAFAQPMYSGAPIVYGQPQPQQQSQQQPQQPQQQHIVYYR